MEKSDHLRQKSWLGHSQDNWQLYNWDTVNLLQNPGITTTIATDI